MQPIDLHKLMLLSHDEFGLRLDRVRAQMAEFGIPALLISDNANQYYLTDGRTGDFLRPPTR